MVEEASHPHTELVAKTVAAVAASVESNESNVDLNSTKESESLRTKNSVPLIEVIEIETNEENTVVNETNNVVEHSPKAKEMDTANSEVPPPPLPVRKLCRSSL